MERAFSVACLALVSNKLVDFKMLRVFCCCFVCLDLVFLLVDYNKSFTSRTKYGFYLYGLFLQWTVVLMRP